MAKQRKTAAKTGKKQGKNKGYKWKPGQSGNPNGRPLKGYSITEMMKQTLTDNPTIKKNIVDKIAEKAQKGDLAAAKLVWGYMDGAPDQNLDVKSGGEKLSVSIVNYEDLSSSQK